MGRAESEDCHSVSANSNRKPILFPLLLAPLDYIGIVSDEIYDRLVMDVIISNG